MRMLSAITGLLYCVLETFGFPAHLKCVGKRHKEQIHFEVLPDITDETRGCDIQWLVNEKVMAYCEGNGKPQYKVPIKNATANTAIMEVDSGEVKYFLDCPSININRKLPCSYLAAEYPATLDRVPGNGTSAEQVQYGFPDWVIFVAVIAVILLCFVVLALVIHKLVRKKPRHYASTDENDAY